MGSAGVFPGDGPLPVAAAAAAAAPGRLAISVAAEGDAAPQAVDKDKISNVSWNNKYIKKVTFPIECYKY